MFYFYFGEKRPALDFLHLVQKEVRRIHRQVAVADNQGDEDYEEGVVAAELEGGDNYEEAVSAAQDHENKEHAAAAPDDRNEDDSEEEDPYSSMFETQQWPYDPNAGSGIYY